MVRLTLALACAVALALSSSIDENHSGTHAFLAKRASTSTQAAVSDITLATAGNSSSKSLSMWSNLWKSERALQENPNPNTENPNPNTENPNANAVNANPNPNTGINTNTNPAGALVNPNTKSLSMYDLQTSISSDLLKHRRFSAAAVFGPATGALIGQFAATGKLSVADGLNWLGVTATSAIAMLPNPVYGVIAGTLFSFFSGLFGGLFAGPSQAEQMQDLLEDMMEDVKELIKFSVVKAKIATVRNKLTGITDELSWVPQLLQANHTTIHPELQLEELTRFNYNLVVQHDLATMMFDMFHEKCIEFVAMFGSDYHLHASEKHSDCKEWQEAGTFIPEYQYVMLHINQLLDTATGDMSYYQGIMDRLKGRFTIYYRLLKDSFQTYKPHRLSKVKSLGQLPSHPVFTGPNLMWGPDGLKDEYIDGDEAYFGDDCGLFPPPQNGLVLSIAAYYLYDEPKGTACYNDYHTRISNGLDDVWRSMDAALDHVRAPLAQSQAIFIPSCAWSTSDAECEFDAGHFAIGRLNSEECPTGSTPITDAVYCQDAAHFLGFTWVESSGVPGPCQWREDGDKQQIGLASGPGPFKTVCIKEEIPKHWALVAGSSNEKKCLSDAATHDSGLDIGTVCCDAASGVGARPDCKTGRFQSANDFCSLMGMRLCSLQELQAGAGVSTGCGFDDLPVWSSSECEPYVCATGEDQDCSCDGDVYYGKKFLNSAKSGATTSFQQMQTWAFMKTSASGTITCGNNLGDPLSGQSKWCYCEPR